MANFNYGTIYGDYGDEKFTSTTNDIGAILGTRMILPDGRVFRYAFSDGAVGAGKGVQSSIALANSCCASYCNLSLYICCKLCNA